MTTLAVPKIALAIPFWDCNVSTSDPTYAVPVPPWAVGSVVAPDLYGLESQHSHYGITSSTSLRANRTGSGRSILSAFSASHDGPPIAWGGTGGGNSYFRTPTSHLNYVPNLGVSVTRKFSLVLTHRVELASSNNVKVGLEQLSGGASGTKTIVATFTSADDTGGAWETVTVDFTVTISASTDSFRLWFWTDSNATPAQSYGLDFFTLAWMPGEGSGTGGAGTPLLAMDERYTGKRFGLQRNKQGDVLRSAYGDRVFPYMNGRGRRVIRQLQMNFLRVSETFAQDMDWFYQVGAGNVSGGNPGNVPTTIYGDDDLGGKLWPLVLIPNKPGVKQALLCRIVTPPFDVDNATGWVETATKFSGMLVFEELDI